MKITPFIYAVSLTLLCALTAGAYEFQSLGYQSIGMGGAGVASAEGSMAGYYNPALLATQNAGVDITASFAAGLQDNGLLNPVKTLQESELTELLTQLNDGLTTAVAPNFTPDQRRRIRNSQSALNEMATPPQKALSVQPGAVFAVKVNKFNIGAYALSEGFVSPVVGGTELIFKDTQNIAGVGNATVYYQYNPGDPDNGVDQSNTISVWLGGVELTAADLAMAGYALPVNTTLAGPNTLNEAKYQADSIYYTTLEAFPKQTYLSMGGNATLEIPVSYALTLPIPIGKLSVGASAKAMQGYSFATTADIDSNPEDLASSITNNQINSTAFGLDAGVLYQPPFLGDRLTLGVVGKNLNSPVFKDSAGVDRFTLDPFYRAGINVKFSDKLNLAADYDLTTGTNALGYSSRNIGGGINFKPFNWMALQLGAMQNIEDPDKDNLIYTGGIGLGWKWLSLNVAAQMSKNKVTVNGSEIPKQSRVCVSLRSQW